MQNHRNPCPRRERERERERERINSNCLFHNLACLLRACLSNVSSRFIGMKHLDTFRYLERTCQISVRTFLSPNSPAKLPQVHSKLPNAHSKRRYSHSSARTYIPNVGTHVRSFRTHLLNYYLSAYYVNPSYLLTPKSTFYGKTGFFTKS